MRSVLDMPTLNRLGREEVVRQHFDSLRQSHSLKRRLQVLKHQSTPYMRVALLELY